MNLSKRLFLSIPILVAVVVAADVVHSQLPGRRARRSGEESLAQPFRGVVAGGKLEKGLFKLESTGVTTEPVMKAAKSLLAGLSEEQKTRAVFPVDDLEWRKWDNRHFYKRQGVGFDEMDEKQRQLAFGLMQASLSAKGLKKSQDIMKLNGTLAELTNNFEEYGEWLYWITIMGEPSMTKPWGWQIDGHHLVINYFVLGDQVVVSPVFMGSEPIAAKSGKFKGTIVLQEEQDKGLKLMLALDPAQQRKATIRGEKGPTDTLAEAYRDNLDLDYTGICAKDLSEEQRTLLMSLIEEYLGNVKEDRVRVTMDQVQQQMDRTYFSWIGDATREGVFYYRIHSPVILIEFDHQRPIALARSRVPTRNHIHTVVRTPNGNDYGKDLLRQHYEQHHHGEHSHKH